MRSKDSRISSRIINDGFGIKAMNEPGYMKSPVNKVALAVSNKEIESSV